MPTQEDQIRSVAYKLHAASSHSRQPLIYGCDCDIRARHALALISDLCEQIKKT